MTLLKLRIIKFWNNDFFLLILRLLMLIFQHFNITLNNYLIFCQVLVFFWQNEMICQNNEMFLENNLIIFWNNLVFFMKKWQKNNHFSWFLNIIFFDFSMFSCIFFPNSFFLYAISAFSFHSFLYFSLSMAQFPHNSLENKQLFE